jgi:phosphate acetyltransferase
MGFIENLKKRVKDSGETIRIVYPDGEIETCVRAAAKLKSEGIIEPVILGDAEKIKKIASDNGLDIEGVRIVNPEKELSEDYVNAYYELRKHKGVKPEQARETMKKVNYYGAMMVHKGEAQGMVCGLTSETKPFIPAFEIIKTKEGITRASSVFFMVKEDDVKLYADCAMNINPDEKTLAEIGAASGDTAKSFGFEPKIAFLSFSTYGSADHEMVDKVKNATERAKKLRPDYMIDGEMQFDAALLEKVAQKKCPESKVGGKANVFIFPELNAGNIAYKITERLAGYKAIGPVFQGLRKPVNDLSRGAKPEDVADTGYLTAVQSLI